MVNQNISPPFKEMSDDMQLFKVIYQGLIIMLNYNYNFLFRGVRPHPEVLMGYS